MRRVLVWSGVLALSACDAGIEIDPPSTTATVPAPGGEERTPVADVAAPAPLSPREPTPEPTKPEPTGAVEFDGWVHANELTPELEAYVPGPDSCDDYARLREVEFFMSGEPPEESQRLHVFLGDYLPNRSALELSVSPADPELLPWWLDPTMSVAHLLSLTVSADVGRLVSYADVMTITAPPVMDSGLACPVVEVPVRLTVLE
jgi:hypothetical protein